MLTVKEMAAELNRTPTRVLQMIWAGQLTAKKNGRTWLVSEKVPKTPGTAPVTKPKATTKATTKAPAKRRAARPPGAKPKPQRAAGWAR